jgi:hypothetical protein
MAAKEELFKELAQQKELREKRGPEQLKDWGKSLERLFGQLRGWLTPAEADNLLRVEEDRVSLREEGLGAYAAPSLRVITPRGEVVRIIPKGRVIVGALGRVDFECSPKKAMLVQRAPHRWQFAELTLDPGGWSFEDLTEDSFWETLRYLLS